MLDLMSLNEQPPSDETRGPLANRSGSPSPF